MPIDFSDIDRHLSAVPAPNDDVAYLRQHVQRFIRAVDTQETLQTQVVLPLPLGTWNVAVLLQPANVVLKLSPWSDRFEADFLKLANEVGGPVPACIGYGSIPDPKLPHASYVLMQYIPNSHPAGHRLEQGALSAADLTAIGSAVGAALACLHTVTFPYLRHFDHTPPDWGTCLSLWDLLETDLFDPSLLIRFVRILERSHYRQVTQGALIHSDANLHNVLIAEHTNAFQALIDPGPMMIGMPMYDLAYAIQPWNYGSAYQKAVTDAYQKAGGTVDLQLFYTSLLCVAYQQSRYYVPNMARLRPFLESEVLSQLE